MKMKLMRLLFALGLVLFLDYGFALLFPSPVFLHYVFVVLVGLSLGLWV